MPWLALPFMDQNCRKLLRLFSPYYSYDHDGVLVILGPGGNILDTCGAMILWKYGIEAYPFTREKLMETEIAPLKTHTLESVMTSLGVNYVNTKLGATIQISDLLGKCVLLFVAKGGYSQSRKLLPKLLDWYGNTRCSENSFEVIFFSYDEDMSSFINFDSKLPWMALPLDRGIDRSLEKMFKVYNFTWLIAFGRDGRFLTNYGEILLRKCEINERHVYNHLLKNVKIQIELELGIRESLLFYPMEVSLDVDDDEDNDSSSDMSLGIDRAFNEDDNEEEEEEEEEEKEEMEVDLCSRPAGSERTDLFSSASLASFC